MLYIYRNDVQYCVGVDSFVFDPGEIKNVNCNVCHSICDIKRNVEGIKPKYGAGMGFEKIHDEFYCPKSNNEWHKKAVKLYNEAQGTESNRLSELINKDLDNILISIPDL